MNENKSEQELHTENLANQETAAGEGGELNLSIEEQLAQATQKLTEMQDSFLRAKAEGENIRRRAMEDIAKAHKFAIEGFAEHLIPVSDSLYAALATEAGDAKAFKEGLEITLKQLISAFDQIGDIIIVRIPDSLIPKKQIIGKTLLEQVSTANSAALIHVIVPGHAGCAFV